MRRLRSGLGLALILGTAGVAGWVSDVVATEPYLAIRTGRKCSACHVNRTGGGGRNDFGNGWAQTMLPMRTVGVKSRSVNDWISIGFDLRAMASGFVQEPEPAGSAPRTSLDVNELQVQLEARLIPNRLALYLDETVGPGPAQAREAFVLADGLPANGYAKAGKFMPPFGWRLWDDDAFIRAQTGFTYVTPDVGAEFGIEPGPLSWFVSVTNGALGTSSEDDSGKMIASQLALVYPAFRIGASGAANDRAGGRRDLVGGFSGFRVGPLVVLGEADWIFDSFDARPDTTQFVAYVEGNLLAAKGWNVKLTYGYHDRNVDRPEDHRSRARFGLEVFPVSFVQVSAFYVLREDIPQAQVTDRDRATLEVHLHF